MNGSVVFGALAFLMVYMLPTGVAYHRHQANRSGLCVLNLAFGWTGLGWLGLMAWAILGARDEGKAGDGVREMLATSDDEHQQKQNAGNRRPRWMIEAEESADRFVRRFDAERALQLQISTCPGGVRLHAPNREPGAGALGRRLYCYKADAYRQAVKMARASGRSELVLFMNSRYRAPDDVDTAGLKIVVCDLSVPSGREIKRRLWPDDVGVQVVADHAS